MLCRHRPNNCQTCKLNMRDNEHIWNHFVSSGRLEDAWREPILPNSGLRTYLNVVRKLFSEREASKVFEEMARLRIGFPNEATTSPVRKKLSDLVAQEPLCEDLFRDNLDIELVNSPSLAISPRDLFRDKLSPKLVSQILREFAIEKVVSDSTRAPDGAIFWTFPTDRSDICVELERYSKFNGLRYSVRLFPKDSKRIFSTCFAYFVSEDVWGYGIGHWDLLFEENDLRTALESLFKNIECIRESEVNHERQNQ